MIPYRIIGAGLATVVFGAAAYWHGVSTTEDACQAQTNAMLRDAQTRYSESLQRAIEQAEAIARQDAEVLTQHTKRAEHVRTVFRDIEREVIRYVQNPDHAVVCLADDGLRLWAAANAGRVPEANREADPDDTTGALPGDSTARIRAEYRPAGQSHACDEGVPPVPGTRAGVDGMEPTERSVK